MGRTYGKIRKKTVRTPKQPPKGGAEPLKIKLRGKDNAPLSMKELQQGVYKAARPLLVDVATINTYNYYSFIARMSDAIFIFQRF